MKLFGWFRKNRFDLDGDGQVESLRQEIAGVFSQFKTAHDKLNEVNEKLNKVVGNHELDNAVLKDNLQKHIVSEEAKIDQNLIVIEKAKAEIQANVSLQKTVKQFIVE